MNHLARRFLIVLGEYALFVFQVIVACAQRLPSWALIREQMYNVGVLSLPVVAFTGLSTGMVLAAQSIFQLSDKGLAGATGIMVAKAMMTELGPVLTAFMVTGRVGAAMCAELGTMQVTEQIDAMRSMSTNPLRYLVGPRFMAGTIMLPLLAVFSTLMGVLGGYGIAVTYYGMASEEFLEPLHTGSLTYYDFGSGLFKSFVFGIQIVTISCFKGMTTSGGAAGVGRSTTNSVVICYSVILISNFLLTVGMNSAYGAITQR